MNNPKISIMMPVYNCGIFVSEAIDSILNQTFTDFEFIIIDDGSTDNSLKNICQYKDPRIKVINYKQHRGIAECLNYGIKVSGGKYIARMDADDISLKNRLEKQYEYLNKNKNIGACGTWIKLFGGGFNSIIKYPIDENSINVRLLFDTPFAHPTVMIRKNILLSNILLYDELKVHAEDYDLWVRLHKYSKYANIGEVLYLYRQHKHQISRLEDPLQQDTTDKIRIKQLEDLNIKLSDKEKSIYLCFCRGKQMEKIGDLDILANILEKKILIFAKEKGYDTNIMGRIISEKWHDVIFQTSAVFGFRVIERINIFPYKKYMKLSYLQKVKLSAYGLRAEVRRFLNLK